MDSYSLKPDELPDLTIEKLGSPTIDSPLIKGGRHFTDDDEKVLLYSHSENLKASAARYPADKGTGGELPMFERAGPRRKIFFEPEKLNCGIVTCGGLCPGLNDVIRTITLSLLWQYRVKAVFGFRYGYAGLSSKAPSCRSGARSSIDEELPISNVIGRIRFVPEPHTKSIMVLAPPEFIDEIEELIGQLDVPGKQVMIEAIIVEVEHTKVTSLGIELSTNPGAFGSAGENALTALANITHMGIHGSTSGIISPNTGFGATGSGTVLGIGTDVYALLDFLIKTTDAKILNQQTLWTKDNEEASFFKGSNVPFLGATTLIGGQGGSQQAFTYELVGMDLRARPSITPEDKVDMIVNVLLSQLTAEREQNIPIRSQMNTTTNMIVQNNQTLLLGGILFQKDSKVEAKLPLFGDLPLVGGLFRHNSVIQTNSELLVFMTPHVVDESAEELPEAVTEKKEILENIRGQLEAVLEVIG